MSFNGTTGICGCGYISYQSGIDRCPRCDAPSDPSGVLPTLAEVLCGGPVDNTVERGLRFKSKCGIKKRPSFNEVWMRLAITMSERSTCERRQVGCVIVSDDNRRVLAVGYNGNAEGLPNVCDEPGVQSGCGCIHAEENATISCVEPRSTNKIVYTTVFPCKMCAKRLLQLGGVTRVYYREDYHNVEASTIFESAGVVTVKLSDNWDGE